jgi:hypothetical protein
MPQSIFESRVAKVEYILINNFIEKLHSRIYLIDSPAVAIFSDVMISGNEKLEAAFSSMKKAYESKIAS